MSCGRSWARSWASTVTKLAEQLLERELRCSGIAAMMAQQHGWFECCHWKLQWGWVIGRNCETRRSPAEDEVAGFLPG